MANEAQLWKARQSDVHHVGFTLHPQLRTPSHCLCSKPRSRVPCRVDGIRGRAEWLGGTEVPVSKGILDDSPVTPSIASGACVTQVGHKEELGRDGYHWQVRTPWEPQVQRWILLATTKDQAGKGRRCQSLWGAGTLDLYLHLQRAWAF